MKLTWLFLSLFCISCSVNEPQKTPILVLTGGTGFGSYTGEILKAEGFNEFETVSTGSDKINLEYLRNFDVVILTSEDVSADEAAVIENYVVEGGALIAFRPPAGLADLFGITLTGKELSEGYISIDTTKAPGKGLPGSTLQYHGKSAIYELKGGSIAATLYETREKTAEAPAVVLNRSGKGRSAVFSYDLPGSIVYTRQGNPGWAGEERDHIDGPTATDLFYPAPGEKQWNDPQRIAIPQADEQMRLLTRIIEQFASESKPLPRFWYFPENFRSVYIFTIDGEDTPEKDINAEIMEVQGKGVTATLFEIGTYIPDTTVKRWRSAGHEVSVHYNDVPHYTAPDYSNMSEVYERMTREFTAVYGLVPRTSRNHWAVWCSKDSSGNNEFSEQASIEEKYGIQFDCNYYQFGGNNVYPNFLGDVGHFTGSGLPMRFSRSDGKIIDVFQSNTQLPDETWLKPNIEAKSKTLIDRSLDKEYYAWINVNFHTWYWPECREAGLRILDHCIARGVPFFTAERVNNFIRTRDEAKFSDLEWEENILSFKVNSSLTDRDRLTIMLPASFAGKELSVLAMDGKKISYSISTVRGTGYVFASFEPGTSHTFSAAY